MDCNGTSLSPSDVVWQFYRTNDPSLKNVIFDFSGRSPLFTNSFNVIFMSSGYTLSSLLYIYNIDSSYTQYTFNCQCNIYKGCASTVIKPSTTAVINILTSKNFKKLMNLKFIILYYLKFIFIISYYNNNNHDHNNY